MTILLLNLKIVMTKALIGRYSNCKRFFPTSNPSKSDPLFIHLLYIFLKLNYSFIDCLVSMSPMYLKFDEECINPAAVILNICL